MLWSDFVLAVNSHLAVESTRRGLTSFRDRYQRNAVLDLQRYIRSYRQANKTTYAEADLTTESQAQWLTLPTGAIPKAAYIYSLISGDDPNCKKERLEFYPWVRRQDLICGNLDFMSWWGCAYPATCCTSAAVSCIGDWNTKAYVYTQSPMSRTMLIYPRVTASTRLLLVWDGYKYTFAPTDDVPYPEEASEAVAAYILWKIASAIDKDQSLAKERGQEYGRLRLSLFRDAQDKLMLNEEKDEELGAVSVAP